MVLDTLLELQKIDNHIQKIEQSLGDLPEKVEDLQSRLNTTEQEIVEIKHEIEQLDAEKRKFENEISLFNEKLKKYQDQVYSVTTNKEYDAISAEIEATKEKIESDESSLLELMEREEQTAQSLTEKEAGIEKLKVEYENKNTILSRKIQENEDELKHLKEARESVAGKIKKPLYRNYERIRKARGPALVDVKNYTCQGCFATIPAQTVVEVRKMNNIILCETCGRILVATNNNSEKS